MATYDRAGETASALKLCDLLEKVLPDNARPLLLRGALLQRAGKLDEAEAQYAKAVAVQPRNLQGYLSLANVQAARENLPGAPEGRWRPWRRSWPETGRVFRLL